PLAFVAVLRVEGAIGPDLHVGEREPVAPEVRLSGDGPDRIPVLSLERHHPRQVGPELLAALLLPTDAGNGGDGPHDLLGAESGELRLQPDQNRAVRADRLEHRVANRPEDGWLLPNQDGSHLLIDPRRGVRIEALLPLEQQPKGSGVPPGDLPDNPNY